MTAILGADVMNGVDPECRNGSRNSESPMLLERTHVSAALLAGVHETKKRLN